MSASRAIHHVALPADWAAARTAGTYTTSTRGAALHDVGFIHCAYAEQVAGVANRFYRDVPEIVVLTIDAGALRSRVVDEPAADGVDELFPHVYGPIELAAVTATAVWRRGADGTYGDA